MPIQGTLAGCDNLQTCVDLQLRHEDFPATGRCPAWIHWVVARGGGGGEAVLALGCMCTPPPASIVLKACVMSVYS
jgi:hypothetical protein